MLTERIYTPEYAPKREFKTRPVRKNQRNVKVEFNERARRRTIAAIAAMGVFFVLMVITAAFASNLVYGNNELIKENKIIANEVQVLKINIKSSMNISSIEKTATEQLGMIYPTGNQFVNLDKTEGEVENFSELLKKEAYN